MDDLLERFLWKGGNVGEKVRLDQVSETFHLLLVVLAVQIAKTQKYSTYTQSFITMCQLFNKIL